MSFISAMVAAGQPYTITDLINQLGRFTSKYDSPLALLTRDIREPANTVNMAPDQLALRNREDYKHGFLLAGNIHAAASYGWRSDDPSKTIEQIGFLTGLLGHLYGNLFASVSALNTKLARCEAVRQATLTKLKQEREAPASDTPQIEHLEKEVAGQVTQMKKTLSMLETQRQLLPGLFESYGIRTEELIPTLLTRLNAIHARGIISKTTQDELKEALLGVQALSDLILREWPSQKQIDYCFETHPRLQQTSHLALVSRQAAGKGHSENDRPPSGVLPKDSFGEKELDRASQANSGQAPTR